jgi:hypothetical protein
MCVYMYVIHAVVRGKKILKKSNDKRRGFFLWKKETIEEVEVFVAFVPFFPPFPFCKTFPVLCFFLQFPVSWRC